MNKKTLPLTPQTETPAEQARETLAPAITQERQDVIALAMELAQAKAVPGERRGRHKAAALRMRMAGFRAIYNAGWMVRYTQHATQAYRDKAIADFCQVLESELARTKDKEALLYAVADTLTSSPHGLPWES